ncbi:complex I NDUFA9 subunit family protein [Haladaptatus sp. GCM10025707]|uniref:complex I NDUFA9 subunit family protein n=1 Tax=unclassified Haladaptatus TaxID=2622732 RepID=UPI0023E7F22E|nr:MULTISPECIES: complex I NDUFA9 subunit family protein [unclassified Haladaptatus]
MKVLVTGGTGFVGSALCKELTARGHDVTALARSPDDAALPEGVNTVRGNVTAYDSIEGAFEGQDAVVNLVALSPLFKPKGGLSHEKVHLGGTRNVVKAAKEHGVSKIVQQSALGADPNGPTAYIRTKGQAEQVVRDSGLDWVIFRPSIIFGDGGEFISFTKSLTTPVVTALPGANTAKFQPIWIGDFVPMLADAVDDDAHVGHVYEIGGPEVLTLGDVTRLIYQSKGKSVSVVPVPLSLVKVGATITAPLPFIPFGPDQARSLKLDNTTSENDINAFGVSESDLTTLGTYLRENQ